MSDQHDTPAASPPPATTASVAPTAADLPLISPVAAPSSPLVRFGGLLGIAGSALGLLLLVIGCAGYSRALSLGPACIGLGAVGLVLSLAGAFAQKRRIGEDTHVLQALFACLMSVIGGLLETAIWLKWPIFK